MGILEDGEVTFAENLKRLMREQDLTVKELAAHLCVSTVCVQHWRNGRWEPKMQPAIRLARKLGTTVEEIAGTPMSESLRIVEEAEQP